MHFVFVISKSVIYSAAKLNADILWCRFFKHRSWSRTPTGDIFLMVAHNEVYANLCSWHFWGYIFRIYT